VFKGRERLINLVMMGDRMSEKGTSAVAGSVEEELYSILGEISFSYALDGLDEILPENLKSEEEMNEIQEVMAHGIEVCMMVMHQLLEKKTFKVDRIHEIAKALESEDFEKADELLLDEQEGQSISQ
jgi:hypothetical protein